MGTVDLAIPRLRSGSYDPGFLQARTRATGSVGDALDNALRESAIGLYKTELIDQHPTSWSGWAEVERETAAWVHWYNTTRLHSALGYRPPIEYEHHHQEAITTTIRTVEVA